MDNVKEKILDIIKTPVLANFATVTEDGKPWTRYVMIIGREDFSIRFSTFVNARKVKQIENNPEVHLTCGITDLEKDKSYLQIQGRSRMTVDLQEKRELWNPQLATYFTGPDDLNYGVIITDPYRIEVYNMEKFEPEIWER